MTGPEHYVEAERLVGMQGGAERAQVHATLALAAAVGCALASPELVDGHRIGDGEAWERVASVLATQPAEDDDVVEAEILDEVPVCRECEHEHGAGEECACGCYR